jgi:hypothetical protein
MRYLFSRPFVVGLLLVLGAIVSTPLLVRELAEETCTTPSPTNSSWECTHLIAVDFRVPAVVGVSGIALMLLTIARMRRANRN